MKRVFSILGALVLLSLNGCYKLPSRFSRTTDKHGHLVFHDRGSNTSPTWDITTEAGGKIIGAHRMETPTPTFPMKGQINQHTNYQIVESSAEVKQFEPCKEEPPTDEEIARNPAMAVTIYRCKVWAARDTPEFKPITDALFQIKVGLLQGR